MLRVVLAILAMMASNTTVSFTLFLASPRQFRPRREIGLCALLRSRGSPARLRGSNGLQVAPASGCRRRCMSLLVYAHDEGARNVWHDHLRHLARRPLATPPFSHAPMSRDIVETCSPIRPLSRCEVSFSMALLPTRSAPNTALDMVMESMRTFFLPHQTHVQRRFPMATLSGQGRTR